MLQGWELEHAEETMGPLYTDAVLGEQGRLYSARLRDRPSQLARLHTPPALPQVLVHAIRAAAQRLYKVCGSPLSLKRACVVLQPMLLGLVPWWAGFMAFRELHQF